MYYELYLYFVFGRCHSPSEYSYRVFAFAGHSVSNPPTARLTLDNHINQAELDEIRGVPRQLPRLRRSARKNKKTKLKWRYPTRAGSSPSRWPIPHTTSQMSSKASDSPIRFSSHCCPHIMFTPLTHSPSHNPGLAFAPYPFTPAITRTSPPSPYPFPAPSSHPTPLTSTLPSTKTSLSLSHLLLPPLQPSPLINPN